VEVLALLLAAGAAAAPEVSTSAVTAPETTITLSAVGDIRLDGPIAAIAKEGAGAPSQAVKDLLDADIVLGNLETPLTKRGTKTAKTWNFRADPKLLKIVKAAGFNLLNIANNHVWDYGQEGFLDTLKALKKNGWAYIGGGHDRAAAEKVHLVEFEGLTVGFLGMTSTHPEQGWAKTNKPGVFYSDFGRLNEVVKRAKAKCDVLVVSFHGGTELAEEPNDIQKAVAHAVIDAGADLFLGHHPHVIQGVEIYKGKAILYSLGNFLFVSPSPVTRPSVIVRATLAKDGVRRLDLIPIDTNWGRPKPASAEVAAVIRQALDRLGALETHPDLLHFQLSSRIVEAPGGQKLR